MTLSLENLTIRKQDGEVLFSDCHFTIQPGEILTLMGPSGCGKSTLLDVVAGHLAPDFRYSGKVILNDQRIDTMAPHKRHVGILFQDDLLFSHLNVWENLAFALPNSVRGEARKQQAIEALKKIQLSMVAEQYPEQLSGGQRARISLTRMLLAKPNVALLDEPFSKLDKELRTQFRDWVMTQLAEANIPTLMVTHDEDDIPPNSQVLKWPWEGAHA
ncbi:ATP-binding cassette domain-containing protein [Vibrio sp. 10N]|uniref:ATP-binding cassette domain-containing protein n=1 Tax=Vibrio sp. 10N TaxID=3058938 RepID=UPI00281466DD|nr:ATP-binding cassette domain-containing protein [Vibrio sp. 10N]